MILAKRERDTETDPGKEGDRHRPRLTLAKRETGTETDPGKEGDRHRD